MALASDRPTQPISLSFEDFLAQYGDDNRYERRATGKPNAYLAYLRHEHLRAFDAGTLQAVEQKANALVERLMGGNFTPKATHHACGICSYGETCEARQAFE